MQVDILCKEKDPGQELRSKKIKKDWISVLKKISGLRIRNTVSNGIVK
jgi:hypothetical protein